MIKKIEAVLRALTLLDISYTDVCHEYGIHDSSTFIFISGIGLAMATPCPHFLFSCVLDYRGRGREGERERGTHIRV